MVSSLSGSNFVVLLCISFYCIVLLTTLFVSSCYWQPFPLDSRLSVPWAENITTFADALNDTLISNYSGPVPHVIRAVDRCWCDFSTGGFFEPFNMSHWEHVTVERLKDELERQQSVGEQEAEKTDQTVPAPSDTEESVKESHAPLPPSPPVRPNFGFRSMDLSGFLWPLSYNSQYMRLRVSSPSETTTTSDAPSAKTRSTAPLQQSPTEKLPILRKEYDLRPYGFGIILDFSWSR